MEGKAYTLARWLVQEGREDEFIRQWTERLAPTIQGLVPSARGTLVRSVENRLLFYSFGPWKDVDEASTVRTGESVDEVIGEIRKLCEEATPGVFEIIAEIG